jgi:hypothetical protein
MTRTFDEFDAQVQRAANEALAVTGLSILKSWTSGRALGICETKDAYELRIGFIDPWTRVISRQELAGACPDFDDAALIAEVNGACHAARTAIAAHLRAIADKVQRQ